MAVMTQGVKSNTSQILGKRSCVMNSGMSKQKEVSSRLEEDANGMEIKLQELQFNLAVERQKREKERPLRHGGNRWKSAREDRGSVSMYAKDLHTKINTKSNRKSQSQKTKEVAKKTPLQTIESMKSWTTSEVGSWLPSIGLEEYQSAMEFHHITGQKLLEMELHDYLHIGITRLSSRNRLFHEIQRIKEVIQCSEQLGNSSKEGRAAEIVDSKLHKIANEVHPNEIHWSHVKPLTESNVASQNIANTVNLADGHFDEKESHQSFLNALLDWRQGDTRHNAIQNNTDTWTNPADADNSNGGELFRGFYDEKPHQDQFQKAVLAWRSGTSGTNKVDKISSQQQIDHSSATIPPSCCWQCYRICKSDEVYHDEHCGKQFCSAKCIVNFKEEYSKLYANSHRSN